jgi:ADP-heptose:LPS heptosyltransferase
VKIIVFIHTATGSRTENSLKRMSWRGDERILILRSEGVAQTLMATPALAAIRAGLPEGHLTLFTTHEAGELAACFEGVDEVVPFPVLWADSRREMAFDPERERAFIDELRSGKYDAAIILTSQAQSSLPAAYACYMAGIPLRLGRSAEAAGSLLTHRVKGFGQGHEVERCLEVVAAWGLSAAIDHPILSIPAKVAEAGERLLRNHGVGDQPYAVVQVPSSDVGNDLSEAAGRIVSELSTRLGLLPVLTGLPQDRVEAEWIAGESRAPSLVMVGETSLSELAAVMAGARMVLSFDLSTAHISSALGVPSLLLFRESPPPDQWLPRRALELRAASDPALSDAMVELLKVNGGRVPPALVASA